MPKYREKKNTRVTFKTVYDKLEKKCDLGDCLEDFKLLLEITGVFLGNPTGSAVAAVIDVLAQKKIVMEAGKRAFGIVKKLETPSYADRTEKMRIAYSLVYYTAFFDAVDDNMPEAIRNQIKLIPEERKKIFRAETDTVRREQKDDPGIVFPDICFGMSEVDKCLDKLYHRLADGMDAFIQGLAFSDHASEKDRAYLREYVESLPEIALKTFHNQFLALCAEFNEFYIYTSIGWNRELESKLDECHRSLLSVAMQIRDCSDGLPAGMLRLEEAINNLPHKIKQHEMYEIADRIRDRYEDRIKEPLFDHDSEEETLVFPPIEKAFIPQAFKLLKYKDSNQVIGAEKTWKHLDPCQDMTGFWAKYIADIDSIDSILLILGEPGIGKSLLTRVVSARISSNSNVVLRIPLREHEVDEGIDIESIVCKQLEDDGDASESISRLKKFAEEFPDNPITLIFDGYDEIQQATGRVYSQFLTKVYKFQRDCKENGRPVRVVVTSRETLVDRAVIPIDTTVMKLLEFDDNRKQKFIHIWNKYNHDVFESEGINDFTLPEGNQDIKQLSSQPLLLTMLAIYDADFENSVNALAVEDKQSERLDRTGLYDKLLRRFIRRELQKGKRGIDETAYNDLNDQDKARKVDDEMMKLGIAALGMFARNKLSIRIEELETDFCTTMDDKSEPRSRNSAMLRDADAFLGSFFFIYDPRSKENREGAKKGYDENQSASFEFLHKTFFEFLIADITLESLFDAVSSLHSEKGTRRNAERLYANALSNPQNLCAAYYAAFASECLCNEPEIIKMTLEWKESKLNQYFPEDEYEEREDNVEEVLNDLFSKHIQLIREGMYEGIKPLKDRCLLKDRHYPQSGAVYLLNLLAVRVLINGQCEVSADTWSFLSQYVKMNLPFTQEAGLVESKKAKYSFAIEPSEVTLLNFMSLFSVTKTKNSIFISYRKNALEIEKKDLLIAKMEVFDFLQDDTSRDVYTLHDITADERKKQSCRERLCKKGMKLRHEIIISEMKRSLDKIIVCKAHQQYWDETLVIDSFRRAQFVLNSIDCNSSEIYAVLSILDNIIRTVHKSMLYWHPKRISDIILRWKDCITYLSTSDASISCVRRFVSNITMSIFKMLNSHSSGFPFRFRYSKTEDLFMCLFKFDVEMALEISIDWIEMTGVFPVDSDEIIYDIALKTHEDVSAHFVLLILKLLNYFNTHENSRISLAYSRSREMIDFRGILGNSTYYFQYETELFPDIMKELIRLGEYDLVRSCLDNVSDLVSSSDERLPDKTYSDLISIAELVGGDGFLSSVYKSERLDINMLLQNYGSAQIDEFLRKYNIYFQIDSAKSVRLLAHLINGDYLFSNPDWLIKAFGYSLSHFTLVLTKSIEAAIDLLSVYHTFFLVDQFDNRTMEKKPFKERLQETVSRYVMCIQRIFDNLLADGKRGYTEQLSLLVDSLNTECTVGLRPYFQNRIRYIKKLNPLLAERIQDKLGLASKTS